MLLTKRDPEKRLQRIRRSESLFGVAVRDWANQPSSAHRPCGALLCEYWPLSRTRPPIAVNRKAKEFRSGFYLAPRAGLELAAFWLTALVVFPEPGTQARKILMFLCLD